MGGAGASKCIQQQCCVTHRGGEGTGDHESRQIVKTGSTGDKTPGGFQAHQSTRPRGNANTAPTITSRRHREQASGNSGGCAPARSAGPVGKGIRVGRWWQHQGFGVRGEPKLTDSGFADAYSSRDIEGFGHRIRLGGNRGLIHHPGSRTGSHPGSIGEVFIGKGQPPQDARGFRPGIHRPSVLQSALWSDCHERVQGGVVSVNSCQKMLDQFCGGELTRLAPGDQLTGGKFVR